MAGSKGDLYVSVPLATISVAYKNLEYIIERILKPVFSDKQSAKYWIFGQDSFDWVDTARSSKGIAKECQSFSLSNQPFFCEGHALRDVIFDKDRENQDTAIDIEKLTTEGVTNKILLDEEIEGATYLFNATTWAGKTAALASADRWNMSTSDPVKKISEASSRIQKAIGIPQKMLSLIVGQEVYDAVRFHPDVLDRFKYTGVVGGATEAQLAIYFQVKEVIIGSSIYNTAVKGQTRSNGFIWGKSALICYIPDNPSIKTPAMGYSFMWRAFAGLPVKAWKYRDADNRGGGADIVEIEKYYQQLIIEASAGYYYTTVVD